jgi:ATP-binding cassette subfamily C protein CydCD
LLSGSRRTRRHVAVVAGLGIAVAATAIGQAWLLADAISRAFRQGASFEALTSVVALLAAVLVVRAALGWGQEVAAQRASAAVKLELRERLLARCMSDAAAGGPTAPAAEMVQLATRGLDALDGYFGRYLPQLVLAAVVPVAVVAVLLPTDLVAGMTVLLTVPLIVVFMILVGWAAEARRTRRWRALARLSHHFLDVVGGLPTLKAFGRARVQLERLAQVTDEYRRETLAALRVAFLSAFVLELVATLSVALVAVGIGLRLVEGSMGLTTGLFILVLAPEAYLPLRQLGVQFHAAEEGLAAAARVEQMLSVPSLPEGARADVPDLRQGRLTVSGVSVAQPGRDVVAPFGASLEVAGGELVVITGTSGAGKSTLLQAILGLRRPTAGRVVVRDGSTSADVADLAHEAWWGQLAYVAQHPYLFPGSLADNLRLSAPEAPQADLRSALAAVGLGGLSLATRVGEAGAGLSSGQRRRVGIARALVRDAPLLVLDEPTAGLDEASERQVLQALHEAARARRCAVLLVAHRPAARLLADRVAEVRSVAGERGNEIGAAA